MDSIVVAARLPTAGGEARQALIDCLKSASVYSKEHEPGVLKYMICLPQDKSDDKTLWAIEEYANKKALDEHLETGPVKSMIASMTANPTWLESTPTIRQLCWKDNLHFAKPEAAQQQDPLIVFAHLEFVKGKRDETIKYWEGNLKSSREEKGTFIYGILEEGEKPNDLFTLEVYESVDYLEKVHVPSEAVQETIKNTGDLRKNLKLAKLQLHGGFMSR